MVEPGAFAVLSPTADELTRQHHNAIKYLSREEFSLQSPGDLASRRLCLTVKSAHLR